MSDTNATTLGVVLVRLYAAVLVAVGLYLAVNGGLLLSLGGSPYYILCGLAVIGSGILLWLRRGEGALLYGGMLLATLAWALWEAGANVWGLMPRVLAPAVLGLALLIPAIRRTLSWRTTWASPTRVAGAFLIAAVVGIGLQQTVPPLHPADPLYQTGWTDAPEAVPLPADVNQDDWLHFGNDFGGSRFSIVDQITPANVARLEPAWTVTLGHSLSYARNSGTPLKVGDRLYMCSSKNDILALDAETGAEIWRYDANTDVRSSATVVCRGVAYYVRPHVADGDPDTTCRERVITNTMDARLIAVDARDGKPCRDFGDNGVVSLLDGMGDVIPGYYFVTSAPTLIQGKVVLGGWVSDNQFVGEPSGVIRAFDAVTGELAWAWDMGVPDRIGAPPEGESYTRGTPNAWGPMSADEELGLVYVGLGNPTPDYYGVLRRPFDEKYGSALVALDAATGRLRWHFQTVHHDLWDYDASAQPVLVDYPTSDGGMARAVLQPTKRGEIFVLDRATGEPLKAIEERPVPQDGAVPGEKLSPTQPFNTEMPAFGSGVMTESDMWGMTPLDQLWCRISFREARYEGPFTPPGTSRALVKAGKIGGVNWSSVSVDKARHLMVVNSSNLPNNLRLIPRDEADALGIAPQKANEGQGPFLRGLHAQEKTPYAVYSGFFLSPLQVPCIQPPLGLISAVDLTTGKLVWSRTLGTARDSGPFGIRSHLPLPMGTSNFGASVVTRGGVTFIAATMDRTFRAFETATGRELWSATLSGSAFATPMTYISPKSGRQFVVLNVGGAATPDTVAEYLVAFALPENPVN